MERRTESSEQKAPIATTSTIRHITPSEIHRRARVLEGLVAIVTGGSRGIGAATAIAFGESGCNVVFSFAEHEDLAHQVVKKIEEAGSRAMAIKVDHTKDEEVVQLVNHTWKEFGRIDIIVNNVGTYVASDVNLSRDSSKEAREKISSMWKVNTDSAVWCVRAASQYIAPKGRIINIGSIEADIVHDKGMAEYAATKAALRGYTKGWSLDFAEKQVTVNLVQPGHIDTPLHIYGNRSEEIAKSSPARRHGTCEEVAEVVLFLASPLSQYVNGATINVDGGFTA
jgi:3-oxoacyl-[acyl-carrier protein] reductase